MKILFFNRWEECPLKSNCELKCKGKCERVTLYEEKLQEDAHEVMLGMRENGDWDGDDDEDVNYNEKYDG